MFWLFLLAVVTGLIIAVRRLLRRQKLLDDDLYSKRVALDHVDSGLAWVRPDGTIGFMNKSLAERLGMRAVEAEGLDWLNLLAEGERDRALEAYSQALLLGIATLDANLERADKSYAWMNVKLVAVHDHKARFIGHHFLTVDRTRERTLESQVEQLSEALGQGSSAVPEVQHR